MLWLWSNNQPRWSVCASVWVPKSWYVWRTSTDTWTC